MAEQNFMFEDEGMVVSGINGNTTSAITAGDLLYASPPSTSPFGTTVPAGVDFDEVEVEPVKFATAIAEGKFIVGIALHDAAAASAVSFATEGLFLSPVIDTTGFINAGAWVRASEGTTTAGVTNAGTTTKTAADVELKVGYALTAANVDGDYILWKLSK